MPDTTTIQISQENKQRLDARKTDSESYDDALTRVLDDSGVLFTEDEIRELARDEAEDAVEAFVHR